MKVEDALQKTRAQFVDANPASRAAHEEATATLPGGNTRTTLYFAPFPLTMTEGSGCRMTDIDGHTYVDLLG